MKKIIPLGLLFMAFILSDVHTKAQAPKLKAAFYYSKGIVVDSKGNVFVIGKNNKLIKITPDGRATCFAGSIHGYFGHKDGQGTAASFSGTKGIAIDADDNIYLADYTRIRKITPDGIVSTLAGNEKAFMQDGNIPNASFYHPEWMTVDNLGNIYVTDEGFDKAQDMRYNVIRKITPQGTISTLKAGPGDPTPFRCNWIRGLVTDKERNLYVCAIGFGNCIKKISPEGIVTNLTGICGASKITAIFKEGNIQQAQIISPTGIAINKQGELFFSSSRLNRIIRIANDKVTTVAGNNKITNYNVAGGSEEGYADGPAMKALFDSPHGIAFDAAGNLYIVDRGGRNNSYIRKLTPDGVVSTFCKHDWNPKTEQYEEAGE